MVSLRGDSPEIWSIGQIGQGSEGDEGIPLCSARFCEHLRLAQFRRYLLDNEKLLTLRCQCHLVEDDYSHTVEQRPEQSGPPGAVSKKTIVPKVEHHQDARLTMSITQTMPLDEQVDFVTLYLTCRVRKLQ